MNLESSGWSLENPYLWLTSGYGGSNGSSTTGGSTTGGTTTSPNDSDPSASSSLSGYLSESWAPQNPQSSDGGSSTPTTGGNPTPPVTNGTTTGTGTPTMPLVPLGQNSVAGDDSPQYEPPAALQVQIGGIWTTLPDGMTFEEAQGIYKGALFRSVQLPPKGARQQRWQQ